MIRRFLEVLDRPSQEGASPIIYKIGQLMFSGRDAARSTRPSPSQDQHGPEPMDRSHLRDTCDVRRLKATACAVRAVPTRADPLDEVKIGAFGRGRGSVTVRHGPKVAAEAARQAKTLTLLSAGAPKGNRTPVFAVKGRRPGPLDDGRGRRGRRIGASTDL